MKNIVKLPSREAIRAIIPLEEKEQKQIKKRRKEINQILQKKSKKKLLVIWPCSLDFQDSAIEYAKRLKKISEKVNDKIFIVMRCYNAKPRTTTWRKWILYNGEFKTHWNIVDGIKFSRRIFSEVTKIWLPIANEILYTDMIPYYEDFLCYAVIGARNSENQQHREAWSWLEMAVGFKNPTSGDFDIATNNVIAASKPNQFLVQGEFGRTDGNSNAHIVIRWQKNDWISKSHISQETIDKVDKYIQDKNLNCMYVIDTSHDNSNQDRTKQETVLKDIMKLKTDNIAGYMTESYLFDGKQNISDSKGINIKHWLSLTDWCIGREKTESLILDLYNNL